MRVIAVNKYPIEIELQMQKFYLSLSEHEKRRYAAIEALKLGHGGKKYICEILGCTFPTLKSGLRELSSQDELDISCIRKPGAGRKNYIEKHPEINKVFLAVIDENTAGSPMDEKIKWTNLSRLELSEKLKEKGFNVSVTVVDQLLKNNNFRRRKASKTIAGGKSENRDDQFKKIVRLKNEYIENGNPVISMDTKKKN